MMYSLSIFRKRYHLTQKEMAAHLNVSVSNYAMMERGERKIPKEIRDALSELQEKYQVKASTDSLMAHTESPDIAKLRLKAEKLAGFQVKGHIAFVDVQLDRLQRKLISMNSRFQHATGAVNMADHQLQLLNDTPDGPEHQKLKLSWEVKKIRALKALESILKHHPIKIAMQIWALRQQQELLEKAAAAGTTPWMELMDGKFLGNGDGG